MDKLDIKSMSLDELVSLCEENKFQKFRAKQLFEWLQNKKAESFDEMLNIPKDMKNKLQEISEIRSMEIEDKYVSEIDDTIKYLFKLPDGEYVETVLMQYKHATSICLSTQVGCRMGCTFCASTKAGYVRNLTPSEIIGQIHKAEKDSGYQVGSIVLMGIGEPLDNFDNVIKFLKLLNDEKGMNMSLRHVSLSTCGIVPKIRELAEYKFGLTLSVSLHAPNDYVRKRTMPIAAKYSMSELLDACKEYEETTGRRVSFEYALIKGINDSDENAKELASKLKGTLCHVNLIPVNEIKETEYKKAYKEQVYRFCELLNKAGITSTVRRTLGADINAACGQLRRERNDEKE